VVAMAAAAAMTKAGFRRHFSYQFTVTSFQFPEQCTSPLAPLCYYGEGSKRGGDVRKVCRRHVCHAGGFWSLVIRCW